MWQKGKMAIVMLEILDFFFFFFNEFWCTGIQSPLFASDFEFWIGVNEYY